MSFLSLRATFISSQISPITALAVAAGKVDRLMLVKGMLHYFGAHELQLSLLQKAEVFVFSRLHKAGWSAS